MAHHRVVVQQGVLALQDVVGGQATGRRRQCRSDGVPSWSQSARPGASVSLIDSHSGRTGSRQDRHGDAGHSHSMTNRRFVPAALLAPTTTTTTPTASWIVA